MRDHDLLPTARALGEDVDVPSVDDLVESFSTYFGNNSSPGVASTEVIVSSADNLSDVKSGVNKSDSGSFSGFLIL